MESNGKWLDEMRRQQDESDAIEIAEDQKIFDGFGAIEQNAKQQSLLRDRQRAIAGAAMMQSAFRNGGMSDRSLSPAFSQAFGQPIYGGQIVDFGEEKGRGFVLYGAAKGRNGNQFIGPVAMMNGAQMLKVLQSAKLGDRTADLQKEIYNDLSSRFTPEQIGSMGVQNPSAPISTGGTVISGSAMRALRGLPRQRSTISVFSNIGNDGKIGTGTYSATIRPDGSRDEFVTGKRSSDYQGKWKVRVSDADGRVYENDKTGEEIRVPNGTNLGDVLAARTRKPSNGLTFDERLQLLRESDAAKNERAKVSQETRKETEEERTKRHRDGQVRAWDNARYSAIFKRLDNMRRAKLRGHTGAESRQYTDEQIAEEEKRLFDLLDSDRAKAFPHLYEKGSSRQELPSSGDNITMPTVAKDTKSITMPDGKVVKKNETYTDSKGLTMRWVGPGQKDWEIVK